MPPKRHIANNKAIAVLADNTNLLMAVFIFPSPFVGFIALSRVFFMASFSPRHPTAVCLAVWIVAPGEKRAAAVPPVSAVKEALAAQFADG
jgi:hypothetical protein